MSLLARFAGLLNLISYGISGHENYVNALTLQFLYL